MGILLSVEINNSQVNIKTLTQGDASTEAMLQNKLVAVKELIDKDGYYICKTSNFFTNATLFALYKEITTDIFMGTKCEELIPNSNMVNDVVINGSTIDTESMDSTIEKILKNMQYHNDVRFKNEPNKAILSTPDLFVTLLVFLLMIRTIDGESTFDMNPSKQTHKVLIMKSMYKEPEKFMDIVYGLLPPNPDFNLKEFIKPSFINYVSVLNESNLSEDIIVGNLIKFLFMQTLLAHIYTHPSKCIDKSKINLYIFKYITRQVNVNNKIKDEYIHIIGNGELISSNILRDKNVLITQEMKPVEIAQELQQNITQETQNYLTDYNNLLNQLNTNIRPTPKPILQTETVVAAPPQMSSISQLFSSEKPIIKQVTKKPESSRILYVFFIVFISLVILGILIFALYKVK